MAGPGCCGLCCKTWTSVRWYEDKLGAPICHGCHEHYYPGSEGAEVGGGASSSSRKRTRQAEPRAEGGSSADPLILSPVRRADGGRAMRPRPADGNPGGSAAEGGGAVVPSPRRRPPPREVAREGGGAGGAAAVIAGALARGGGSGGGGGAVAGKIDTSWLKEEIKESEDIECTLCRSAMQKPFSGCREGHTYCEDCLHEWLQKSDKCPECRESIDVTRLVRNRPIENLVLGKAMWCENASSHARPAPSEAPPGGCPWDGSVGEYHAHSSICDWALVRCAMCPEKVMRKDMPAHAATECLLRMEPCRHCQKPAPFLELEAHEASCKSALVRCQNGGCAAEVTRGGVSKHLKTCGCRLVRCKLGCGEHVMHNLVASHEGACTFRKVPCDLCQEQTVFHDLPAHAGVCPSVVVSCPNEGCPVTLARGGLAEHRETCMDEVHPKTETRNTKPET